MKTLIYTLIFVLFSCNGEKNVDKSETIFNNNIDIIKRYNEGETIKGTGLDDSVMFLEELTNIKSEMTEGIVLLRTPTEENLKAWEEWYKKNKEKLFWDENDQKVKLKE